MQIHRNPKSKIYENSGTFKQIFQKFRGNIMKHNNKCIHTHPCPRPEIYENFGNFKEISEKFRVNFTEV